MNSLEISPAGEMYIVKAIDYILSWYEWIEKKIYPAKPAGEVEMQVRDSPLRTP